MARKTLTGVRPHKPRGFDKSTVSSLIGGCRGCVVLFADIIDGLIEYVPDDQRVGVCRDTAFAGERMTELLGELAVRVGAKEGRGRPKNILQNPANVVDDGGAAV